MKTTTVYLPIPVKTPPVEDGYYFVMTKDCGQEFGQQHSRYCTVERSWYDEKEEEIFPTHYLQPQERIVLTPEQLKNKMIDFANWSYMNAELLLSKNWKYKGSKYTSEELYQAYLNRERQYER